MAELVNEFAFSWSRQKIFYECPRKLYWQYYGSWKGWDGEAPAHARLAYRLKQIKNLAMLVGETFHEELAEILRRRSPRACGVPTEQLKGDMERRLLRRLRESRDADWERYGDPKHKTILFEDYYGRGVTGDMTDQALAALHRCVDGLQTEAYARRVFAAPLEALRFIDPKLDNIDDSRVSLDGLTLYASPDLVVAGKSGGLHILDWKTGTPRVEDVNAAQLAIYGLFVQRKFGTPLDQMTAHLIYVAAGERRAQNVLDGEPEAKRIIATYVTDVQSRLTDVAANVAGDIEAFPMTTNVRLCRGCNFRELCDRLEEPAEASSADD